MLLALRFVYTKAVWKPDSFETLPFYTQHLRKFLLDHHGNITWLKGNTAGVRDAYLLFTENLKEPVHQLLLTPLKNGGYFKPVGYIVTYEKILEKLKKKQYSAIGYLNAQELTIGSPPPQPLEKQLTKQEKEILEKVREGFMLTEYEFIMAEDVEVKSDGKDDWAILKGVLEMGVSHDGKIAYTDRKETLGIRVKDLHLHPTRLESLDKNSLEWKQAQARMEDFKKHLLVKSKTGSNNSEG
jgi:hypothetical protein